MQTKKIELKFSKNQKPKQEFANASEISSMSNIEIDNNQINLSKAHIRKRTSFWEELFSKDSVILKFLWKLFKIVLEFIVVTWIVITLVFFLINSTPCELGILTGLSEAQKKAELAKYGLDLPLIQRYFNYLWHFINLDFGISLTLRPRVDINSFIWQRFLTSFSVGIFSVFLTIAIGVPLGIFVGKNPGKFLDNFSTVAIAVLSSIPSLVFSLILLIIGKATKIPYVFDFQDFATYVLPAIALSIGSIVSYVRYIRYELNNELNSMHAKFAYLKNLTRNRFVWTHALKASLFPIATFFPGVVLGSFVGSVFVEKIFLIAGSGGILIDAIQAKDFNIILFLVSIYSLLTIISYTLRDISYELLDPRIRRKAR